MTYLTLYYDMTVCLWNNNEVYFPFIIVSNQVRPILYKETCNIPILHHNQLIWFNKFLELLGSLLANLRLNEWFISVMHMRKAFSSFYPWYCPPALARISRFVPWKCCWQMNCLLCAQLCSADLPLWGTMQTQFLLLSTAFPLFMSQGFLLVRVLSDKNLNLTL